MRLRYFRLQNYPPLADIPVNFSTESPLQRKCQIHFVVGVKGSGKTHLLQALTATFLALADRKRPHFPVTLI
jgi:predicted ATPase